MIWFYFYIYLHVNAILTEDNMVLHSYASPVFINLRDISDISVLRDISVYSQS